MTLRQKLAALGLGAGICYGVAESTDRRDLSFQDQYLSPREMLSTLDSHDGADHANVIGAVGFDAMVLGAAYSVLAGAGSKKK